MEAVCSSETLADLNQTAWFYDPDDSTLHSYHCKNLTPNNVRQHSLAVRKVQRIFDYTMYFSALFLKGLLILLFFIIIIFLVMCVTVGNQRD
jgi:hypothetical protein